MNISTSFLKTCTPEPYVISVTKTQRFKQTPTWKPHVHIILFIDKELISSFFMWTHGKESLEQWCSAFLSCGPDGQRLVCPWTGSGRWAQSDEQGKHGKAWSARRRGTVGVTQLHRERDVWSSPHLPPWGWKFYSEGGAAVINCQLSPAAKFLNLWRVLEVGCNAWLCRPDLACRPGVEHLCSKKKKKKFTKTNNFQSSIKLTLDYSTQQFHFLDTTVKACHGKITITLYWKPIKWQAVALNMGPGSARSRCSSQPTTSSAELWGSQVVRP